jgi:hypothetical protein
MRIGKREEKAKNTHEKGPPKWALLSPFTRLLSPIFIGIRG